jgi:hypothetical protein
MRHFGSDCFVAEIETNPISRGPADHTRENRRSMKKLEVWQIRGVAPIPQHARARTALDVAAPGVKWKGGRAADNHIGNWQSGFQQLISQGVNWREGLLASSGAGL